MNLNITLKTLKNPVPSAEWSGKTIKKILRVPFGKNQIQRWDDSLGLVIFDDGSVGYIRGTIQDSAQQKEFDDSYLWDRPIIGTKEYPLEIEEMVRYLFDEGMFDSSDYVEFVEGRRKEQEKDDKQHEEYTRKRDIRDLTITFNKLSAEYPDILKRLLEKP